VGRVAELSGAVDEQRLEAKEEVTEGGGGDEQAMDLVEPPLAGVVFKEALSNLNSSCNDDRAKIGLQTEKNGRTKTGNEHKIGSLLVSLFPFCVT
jgi:hypothetical protein